MKHRIIECQEQLQDFDKYVCAIGLPQLMNATESSLRNEIQTRHPKNHFKLFESNPHRDIKLCYSIAPYGAGGSFLGVLQELAKGEIEIEAISPENRKINLWDDIYGLNFKELTKNPIHGQKRTADLEQDVMDLVNRHTTWEQTWSKFISFVLRFTETHELQVHTDLLTLPFFVETECVFFLDMDIKTFVWTHFLASLKHAANGDLGGKTVRRFMDNSNKTPPVPIHSISTNLERCNTEWKIYCIARKYGMKPKIKISYSELIIDQDYNTVKRFLQATTGADTSDNMISTCQDLLKRYHDTNLKIMKNWHLVSNKVLTSHKWSTLDE